MAPENFLKIPCISVWNFLITFPVFRSIKFFWKYFPLRRSGFKWKVLMKISIVSIFPASLAWDVWKFYPIYHAPSIFQPLFLIASQSVSIRIYIYVQRQAGSNRSSSSFAINDYKSHGSGKLSAESEQNFTAKCNLLMARNITFPPNR